MASTPPTHDVSIAYKLLIPCGVLSAVALAVCVARIWTRVKARQVVADDYMIAIAEVLFLAGYLTQAAAAAHGWGHNFAFVSPTNRVTAFKCVFVVELLWIFSIALVRISVAYSLLRFSTGQLWRGTLWGVIGLQCLISIGLLVFQLAACHPIKANWDLSSPVHCWDRKYTMNYAWTASALVTAIDLVLALMPLQLIRILRRPRAEKILVGCLMGMGLFATAISGFKMSTFHNFGKSDLLSGMVISSMWATLEGLVGLIAACLPPLKTPLRNLLLRFGIIPAPFLPQPSWIPTAYQSGVGLNSVNEQQGSALGTGSQSGTGSERNLTDEESGRRINGGIENASTAENETERVTTNLTDDGKR